MKTTKLQNMKNLTIILLLAIATPLFASAQSDSSISKQMKQLQQQLDNMQMQLDAQTKTIDSLNNANEKNISLVIDTTVLKIGKWNVDVKDDGEHGNVKVQVGGCCDTLPDDTDNEKKRTA